MPELRSLAGSKPAFTSIHALWDKFEVGEPRVCKLRAACQNAVETVKFRCGVRRSFTHRTEDARF